jgi:23S rRNA pseudouridine2457 synthase
MSRIILFNKPYGVLSQFTDEGSYKGLASYIVQPGYYAAGRLDATSEGLLILTDDGALQARISSPKFKQWKTYWAQVEGQITPAAIAQLSTGVTLKDGPTLPAQCQELKEPDIWDRDPPIRTRQHIPTSWLQLSIQEGRNRQVRRMTAAVGFPTLRLVRVAVGDWNLDGLEPGNWKYIDLGTGLGSNFSVNSVAIDKNG